MPAFNSHPHQPQWLQPGTKPLAYCHGFMAGLNQTLDDDLILHVLGPVFESDTPPQVAQSHAMDASVFMRGLYDGVREYHRLIKEPALHRNWKQFLAQVEGMIMATATARGEG